MRVVLTGATGFVGRQVLKVLLEHGLFVRVIVRDHHTLPQIVSDRLEIVETPDLFAEQPERLQILLHESEILVHAAWHAEPGSYLTSPLNIHCLQGTLRLMQAFQQVGGRRFVGIGTCAEYEMSTIPLSVETPLAPTSLYAACKVSTFEVLKQYLPMNSVSFAWCRLFYLYGEGEDDRRLVPYIRKQLKNGEVAYLTDGNQTRDFMDVQEAARRIVQVSLGEVAGAVNVCSGTPLSVRNLALRVAEEYGRADLLSFGAKYRGPDEPFAVVGVPGPYHG